MQRPCSCRACLCTLAVLLVAHLWVKEEQRKELVRRCTERLDLGKLSTTTNYSNNNNNNDSDVQAAIRIDPSLRIHVYDLSVNFDNRAAVLRHRSCGEDQFAADHILIERLRGARDFTASSAAEADFLVVPFLAKCYFKHVADANITRMSSVFAALLQELETKPQWHARPDRHIFFFISGAGASMVPDSLTPMRGAILVSSEGDRESPYFQYGRDIVVPGFSEVPRVKETPVKSLLVSMRGKMHTVTRDASGRMFALPCLLRNAVDQALAGQECSSSGDAIPFQAYVDEARASRFCIVPRGSTPWTRRFFDIIFAGCIPVVLSNPIQFPFERLIDFHRFTIKLPEADAFKLPQPLLDIPEEEVASMQAAILSVQRAFDFSAAGLAFELFLTELSLRKAGPSLPSPRWPSQTTNNSPHHFWIPPRGVYTEPHAVKMGPTWEAGMSFH